MNLVISLVIFNLGLVLPLSSLTLVHTHTHTPATTLNLLFMARLYVTLQIRYYELYMHR